MFMYLYFVVFREKKCYLFLFVKTVWYGFLKKKEVANFNLYYAVT